LLNGISGCIGGIGSLKSEMKRRRLAVRWRIRGLAGWQHRHDADAPLLAGCAKVSGCIVMGSLKTNRCALRAAMSFQAAYCLNK